MRITPYILIFGLAAVPAFANDGFMGLPAGGLTLQQSADIRMMDEDLYLSLEEVRVAYQFRNESAQPVRAQVGFPMPGLPASINFENGSEGYDIHDVKGVDLLKFETRIDGAAVVSRPVVRAFVFPADLPWDKRDTFRFTDGRDVTAELTAAGIPLSFDATAIRAAFARLPPAAQADWQRRGLYEKGTGSEWPQWWLSTIFVREQVFPPGRTVAVQHRYKPIPSGFIMMADHLSHDKDLAKAACVDAPTAAAIKRALSPESGGIGHVLDYVLTTANTWKGPIGRFRLTVDKGAARNLVSLCADGIRKTAPTIFVLERANFSPSQDIKILIVKPGG